METMKRFFCNVIAAFAVACVLVSCAPLTDAAGEGGHGSGDEVMITIKLPQIAPQSMRSLTADEVTELQAATTSYRVTFRSNYKTIVRESASSETSFYAGTDVGITVECLNKDGQVIVRTVEKTVKIRSSNNTVSFKLSEDGTKIVPEPDPAPEPGPEPEPPEPEPEPTPEPEKFSVTYELDGGAWSPDSNPPQTADYAAGDTVTVTSNVPTKSGLMFGGWKPSVGSLAPVGENFYKKDTFTMPGEAVTLTARWGTVARTVLYDDGLFVINELDVNARNVGVTAEYDAMKDDGSNYVFAKSVDRPWDGKKSEIKSVKIGSRMFPTSTAHWFNEMSNCTSINLTNLDTSSVTNMYGMFKSCSQLARIYASSNFVTNKVTSDTNMFLSCSVLRGGKNTQFSSSNTDKTYARIDGGPGSATPGYFTQKP